jgi:hypothetical protein
MQESITGIDQGKFSRESAKDANKFFWKRKRTGIVLAKAQSRKGFSWPADLKEEEKEKGKGRAKLEKRFLAPF